MTLPRSRFKLKLKWVLSNMCAGVGAGGDGYRIKVIRDGYVDVRARRLSSLVHFEGSFNNCGGDCKVFVNYSGIIFSRLDDKAKKHAWVLNKYEYVVRVRFLRRVREEENNISYFVCICS